MKHVTYQLILNTKEISTIHDIFLVKFSNLNKISFGIITE